MLVNNSTNTSRNMMLSSFPFPLTLLINVPSVSNADTLLMQSIITEDTQRRCQLCVQIESNLQLMLCATMFCGMPGSVVLCFVVTLKAVHATFKKGILCQKCYLFLALKTPVSSKERVLFLLLF